MYSNFVKLDSVIVQAVTVRLSFSFAVGLSFAPGVLSFVIGVIVVNPYSVGFIILL